MTRRWLAAGAAAVVAAATLAAVGGWYLLRRDDVQPASIAAAIAAYRQQTAEGGGAMPMPPGVYVYETDGFEHVDALGGATHRYPSTSTITVTRGPCGARLRWDVLEGRSTTWTLCLGADGWTQRTRDERHTFFGVLDRTAYTCHDTAFRPEGDRPGTAFTVICTTGSATERGRGRVVGRQSVEVGETAVDSVHVRTSTRVTGRIRGTIRFDFWLARGTNLPLRVTMASRTTSGSPIGDVHYEEDASLVLQSLTPRR